MERLGPKFKLATSCWAWRRTSTGRTSRARRASSRRWIPVTAFPINAETKIDCESTARLRAGWAFNNVMAYITGGLALQGAKTTLTTPVGPVCGGFFSGCSGTDRQIGAALGAGIEVGFSRILSAKFEYLYITAASLRKSSYQCDTSGPELPFYWILMLPKEMGSRPSVTQGIAVRARSGTASPRAC